MTNDLIPIVIRYHGGTYWLINHEPDAYDMQITIQHPESGRMHVVYPSDPHHQDIVNQIESQRIYHAIRRERAYQDRKYGTIAQRKLLLDNYLGICRRELTEAWNALANGDRDNARCELLQVAAVAIAALEAHGLIERDELTQSAVTE